MTQTRSFVTVVVLTSIWLLSGAGAVAQLIPLLLPGDPMLAFDFDVASSSSYPVQEAPRYALDFNSSTKYLNSGGRDTGFIVTPAAPTVVRSLQFTTANDFSTRDPASWALYGTFAPIQSTDNSAGNAEPWTLISAGPANLPDTRFAPGPVISLTNTTVYASYRLVFPTLKAGPLMQIADVAFFLSTDGTGPSVLSPTDPILAIQLPTSQSRYPLNESPTNALDGNPNTKYLNFGKERSGFIVTPASGPSVVKSFQFTTANDFADRDPAAWELYGTSQPIQSTDNGTGSAENWTLIDQGSVALPLERFTQGPLVPVANNIAYASYRMVITALRNTFGVMVDSVQFSEVQFYTDIPSASIRRAGANVVIDFRGVLQSATNVAGPYNDVPGATSPHNLGPANLIGSQFFRSRGL